MMPFEAANLTPLSLFEFSEENHKIIIGSVNLQYRTENIHIFHTTCFTNDPTRLPLGFHDFKSQQHLRILITGKLLLYRQQWKMPAVVSVTQCDVFKFCQCPRACQLSVIYKADKEGRLCLQGFLWLARCLKCHDFLQLTGSASGSVGSVKAL